MDSHFTESAPQTIVHESLFTELLNLLLHLFVVFIFNAYNFRELADFYNKSSLFEDFHFASGEYSKTLSNLSDIAFR